jgi:hypothetical protein
MSNHRTLTACLVLLFLPICSFAQVETNQPPSLDTLQKLQKVQAQIDEGKDLLDKLNRLSVTMERVANDKYINCLQAFGVDPFCKCLGDNLPIRITFAAYVQIVTSSKEELGYDKLSDDDKQVVDTVLSVREQCVAKLFPTSYSTTNKQTEVSHSPAAEAAQKSH